MDPPPSCYKCGATDHIATNRNCPRPRKSQIDRASCTPPVPSTFPRQRHAETKFIKEARQGDDTKFWYYSEEPGVVDPGSGAPNPAHPEDPKVPNPKGEGETVKRDRSALPGREGLRPSPTPSMKYKLQTEEEVKGLGIKLDGKKQLGNPEGQSEVIPPKKRRQSIRAVAPPVHFKPHSKTTTIKATSRSPVKKTPKTTKPRANTVSKPPPTLKPKPTKKKAPANPRARTPKEPVNEMPDLHKEYLEWCNLPENDPFSQRRIQTGEWNYLGVRNSTASVVRPGAILYGDRALQGWRECRSVGYGLGHQSPI